VRIQNLHSTNASKGERQNERQGSAMPQDGRPIDLTLTVQEVAADLRCSAAHVYKLIKGTVADVAPLAAIRLGRRRLVRRSALECWKSQNETTADNAILPSKPKSNAGGRTKEN
jgi:excisionase family DNA binding protein